MNQAALSPNADALWGEPRVRLTSLGRCLVILIGLFIVMSSVIGHGAIAATAVIGLVGLYASYHRAIAIESDWSRLSLSTIDTTFNRTGPGIIQVPIILTSGPQIRAHWAELKPIVDGRLAQKAIVIHTRPNAIGKIDLSLNMPETGFWWLRGLAISEEFLGVFSVSRIFPMGIRLNIWPSPKPIKNGQLKSSKRVRTHSSMGAFSRLDGQSSDLRELREYVPGDPPRIIAWKASAKRQQLLVRSWHTEASVRIRLVVDMGLSTRKGQPGKRPLDSAIHLASTYARIYRSHEVGLTSYAHRIYRHLEPGHGPRHQKILNQHLMDLTQVVDEDLTEVSTVELLIAVAHFLKMHQSNHQFLGFPSRNKYLPDHVFYHPAVRMLDTDLIFNVVSHELTKHRKIGRQLLHGKRRTAPNLFAARLRVFCALNGISLPYRMSGIAPFSIHGLKDALKQSLAKKQTDTTAVIAPPMSISSWKRLAPTIKRLQARRSTVVFVPTQSMSNEIYKEVCRLGVEVQSPTFHHS